MENTTYTIEEQQSGSLRDFLTVLFKNKYKIVTVFLVTVVTVSIVSFLLPPTYEAKSSLLVKIGREYVYRPEGLDKAPVVSVNQEEAINSEINIMASRDLVQKVITTLGVAQIYPELVNSPPSEVTPLEAAIINFSKDLNVAAVKKSNVLEVTFRHKNPRIAAKSLNLLIDFFKEKHSQVYNEPESVFLGNQLSTYEQKLRESETKMQRFKQSNQVYSLDEQLALLLKQRNELDAALKNARSQINGTQKRLSSLNSQMKNMSESKARYTQTERDKIIVEAKSQLLNRQFKERELLTKYPENSISIANVRKEIALATNFIQQQEEDITSKVKTSNVVYQEVEKNALLAQADLDFEIAKERTQRQQLSQLDGEIRTLDLKEKELQNLKRDVSTNDKNYRTYQDRFEEARISGDMNQQKLTNLSVIQTAMPPARPVKPRKLLNIAISAILGAVSGLGYAFFCEYASQGLSNPENAAKRLGLPVLATIDLRKRQICYRKNTSG